MVNFSAWTVLCAVLQFAALPALLERVASVFFARLRPNLSAADRGVLSQRFARAVVALLLAQGGARAMLAQGRMTMRGTTEVGQYYMLGCVVFYIFDSYLLWKQRARTYDLWVHHILAILQYSYFLWAQVSEFGGCMALQTEFLVPWGFMLFYFKINKLAAHPFFPVIAYGGIITLLCRIAIWSSLMYVLCGPFYHEAPLALFVSCIVSSPFALFLDMLIGRAHV